MRIVVAKDGLGIFCLLEKVSSFCDVPYGCCDENLLGVVDEFKLDDFEFVLALRGNFFRYSIYRDMRNEKVGASKP
jgi:hypothetical protein